MNKKNKEKSIKLVLGTFIGSLAAAIIVYMTKNYFPYKVILIGLLTGIILVIIEQLKEKHSKNDVPETDERVSNNLFKFFSYVSHLTLGIIFVGLNIISFSGNKFIPLNYLWVMFFLYFLIIIVGGFIIKKK